MATPVDYDPFAPSTPDAPAAPAGPKPVDYDPFSAAKVGGAEGLPAAAPAEERDTTAIEPGQVKLTKGMTDEEIAKAFNYDYETIKKSKWYKEGDLAKLVSDENPGATFHSTFFQGAGLEFADSVFGKWEMAARLESKARGGKHDNDIAYAHLYRNVLKSNQLNNVEMGRRVDEDGKQKLDWADLGGIADPLGPGKIKALGKAGNLIIGGMFGGATSPQDQAAPDVGGAEDTYFGTAGQRGVVGGVVGPVVAKTGEAAVGAVGKGINMARGIPEVDSNPAFVEAAREANIPFKLSDVYPDSTTLRGVEQATADAGRAIETRKAATTATEEKVRQFKDDMLAQPFPNSRALERAAKDKNHPRHDEAVALRSHIRQPSEDWNDAIDASGRLEIFNAKLKSDRLYAALDKVGANVTNVPTDNFRLVLQNIAAKRKAEAVPGLQNDYYRMLADMEKGTGMPIATFTDARAQRGALAQLQAKAARMDGAPNAAKIAEDFKALRDAKTEDMKTAARAARKPNMIKALATADEEYKHTSEVGDSMLARAIEKKPELADEVVKLMTEGGRDRAVVLYKSLGERGRAAVRYRMVALAFQNSQDELKRFDPKVFARNIQAKEEELGVFLNGNDKFKIQGFTNMMAHFQNVNSNAAAVQAERLARQGMSSAAIAAGQGNVAPAGVMGVVGQLVGRLGLDTVMNNPTWQKYWLAASDLKPGSPAMEKLSAYMLPALAREAGKRGGAKTVERAEPAEETEE